MDTVDDRPEVARRLRALLRGASGLAQRLADGSAGSSSGAADSAAAGRLRRSVVRPLEAAVVALAAGPGEQGGGGSAVSGDPGELGSDGLGSGGTAGEWAWALAQEATRLRMVDGVPLEVVEATAALQELCCTLAPDAADERRAALAELQATLPTAIQTQRDGPLLVTNAPRVVDWLGLDARMAPQLALCRCGQSGSKPVCDGSHAEIGFSDEKDPNRVPDRLDTYVGGHVTIQDNRGLCAHSGFCTQRLATVFRQGQEPFVAPSGGRMDEIIRAVHACPSGALSLSVDTHDRRDQGDPPREPAIEISRDGPYRITGGIALIDADGAPVDRNAGASLEHYSLCRCGQSQNKPFCSGMHWYVGFADPPLSDEPSLFEWAGGFPGLLRTTRLFYQKHVPADPLLAPLFADMAPDHPERVAAWLGETFGGPKRYTERYGGYDRMVSQHVGKALSEEQRATWARLLIRSADEAGLPTDPEFKAAFVSYIEWGSRIAVENSTPGATPPQHMPVPRWWWVCDATPGSRLSALATEPSEEAPIELPGPGERVAFAQHVKPLFRRSDRQSMSFAFDLWSYDDVSRHADAILDRLHAGSMPCDGAWPQERIDVFERWVTGGKPG
jgi:CDGSH-type Zn-finger protein/truncated hemoglobin YjbI